jgi:Uma2 family endonuclease
MTLLDLPTSRPRRGTVVLPKPQTSDDIAALHDLAAELNGRPVPGVRMTERQFEAWGDEDIKASLEHNKLNAWLLRLVSEFVEHHELGEVLGPEFMMRFGSLRRRRVPDVLFVSNAKASLIRPNHLEGAPDLVMEIVSPDSTVRDWRVKYIEYQKAGVREYWVVDPIIKRVEAYALRSGNQFKQIVADDEARIFSKVLKGFYLRPAWLWRTPLPKLAGIMKELGLR